MTETLERRIRITIAYDGTRYCGWQVQPNGTSIQAVLQAAIEDLVGHPIHLTGASRTDAGVHALGQVAVFDTVMGIAADRFAAAINARLPEDIVVQKSEAVASDFHPRYAKTIKTYKYRILNRPRPLPNERFTSVHVPGILDLEQMREVAMVICGTYDFKSFCSTKTKVKDTVRTIYSADLEEIDGMITLTVTGNGFLYNMVRIIAGTLIDAGFGKTTAVKVQDILADSERIVPGPTAPARGLTLVRICYVDEDRDGGMSDADPD